MKLQNDVKEYEGEYHNSKRNGNGTSYYDGSGNIEYVGIWKLGEKHGQGTLYTETGDLVFTGNFHYDEMQFD